jgi:hypothetical protein
VLERIALHLAKMPALPRVGAGSKSTQLLVGTHKEGVACGSGFGPPNLKSVATIHREAPTIPLDPPGNGPDVTQIKKIRQHKSKKFYKAGFDRNLENVRNTPVPRRICPTLKPKICKNTLALAKTCGRLAPFLGFGIQIPMVVGRIIRCGGFFNRGGQGTWALFFSLSFG